MSVTRVVPSKLVPVIATMVLAGPLVGVKLVIVGGEPTRNAVVEVAVNRTAYGTVPITKAILAEQQLIADTFWELKLLPRKISILEAAQAGVA